MNRYGGVALYIMDHLAVKERKDLDRGDIEAVWAELLVERKKIHIGVSIGHQMRALTTGKDSQDSRRGQGYKHGYYIDCW